MKKGTEIDTSKFVPWNLDNMIKIKQHMICTARKMFGTDKNVQTLKCKQFNSK